MARSFQHASIAASLLILTGGASLILGTPGQAVSLPAVRSLAVSGWVAGAIAVDYHVRGTVRLIQTYAAQRTGDSASVESRCSSDPKDFLKWSGRLAYEGAGYEQMSSAVATLQVPATRTTGREVADVSRVVMRSASTQVVIVYAYIDHWGIHAETPALWPRALGDLLARHPGPYCMLGATAFVGRSLPVAAAEARQLATAFLPPLRQAVAQ